MGCSSPLAVNGFSWTDASQSPAKCSRGTGQSHAWSECDNRWDAERTAIRRNLGLSWSTLPVPMAGSSVLNAFGSADLNGYLTRVLLNGFTPEIGDSFTFIRCSEFGVSGSDEPLSRPLLHYWVWDNLSP